MTAAIDRPSSLKHEIQLLLRRVGIYHRIKSSWLYDLYWKLADSSLIENRRREVEFYRRTLRGFNQGSLIFDVGANVGYKTDIFLRLGAKVVAVEPDLANQDVLRKRFLVFRLAKKPVSVVGKAVAAEAGSQTMWVDKPGSALNTLNSKWVELLRSDRSRFGECLEFGEARQVQTTTLEELCGHYGRPLYVKIDVEGYEANVLSGLNTVIPFISFEVNLPQFRPEALECIDHLERIAVGGKYNYAPDCLRGLACDSWLSKDVFVKLLNRCEESSIEVFWMASAESVGRQITSGK
jgi:FkbM family methyltransferase